MLSFVKPVSMMKRNGENMKTRKVNLFLMVLCVAFGLFLPVGYAHEALVGLEKISLKINPLDAEATRVGVRSDLIAEVIETWIGATGLQISEGQEKPQLEVTVTVVRMFGGYATSYRMQLRDWALNIHEPKTKMLVTTWEKGGTLSTRKKKVVPELKTALGEVTQTFARDYQMAKGKGSQ
jgi:hypothetical protein